MRQVASPTQTLIPVSLVAICFALSSCGYHSVGSVTHLPPNTRSLAIPIFAAKTNAYHTETVMTNAVIREFALRTRLQVSPDSTHDPDTILHGTILTQTSTPLTYNSQTQQSSSFLITITAAVILNARDGRVLYQNDHYLFRQQYQSTTDLPTFLEENPAAIDRLSKDFAKSLVSDVLESF